MTVPTRVRFGIFMAPFHQVGENPTLALERDLELIQWLDKLGFDEAWIGEHHSAGWEIISAPEIFIATAAERTRHIKLGTGVTSLPYHNPLMVANRIVLLDHLTRGRAMLGVGPGALVTDAVMLGLDPNRQREMMDEALDVIVRLLRDPTPLSRETDWFCLRDATLQLRPYTRPYPPIAVASMESPAGMIAAGKHGAAVLSLSVARGQRGPVDLAGQWRIAEETAARAGTEMRRSEWRLMTTIHLAETREEALADVRDRGARHILDYFEQTLGRPSPVPGPREQVVEQLVESGAWIVGTPDDCIRGIERLQERSGGFGGLMAFGHEWAPRDKILKSYELLARYVMPRFQDSLTGFAQSQDWARAHSRDLQQLRVGSLEQAHRAYEGTKK